MRPCTFLIFFVLLVSSCTSFKNHTRKDKDIVITKENAEFLKGCALQNSHKALLLYRLVTGDRKIPDTASGNYNTCITPIGRKRLRVELSSENYPVSTVTLKGRYRKGYFQIRRWKADMIVGPLIWSLTNQLICVGVSKENKLVAVYTMGGQAFLVLFPIMAADADAVYEYEWTK